MVTEQSVSMIAPISLHAQLQMLEHFPCLRHYIHLFHAYRMQALTDAIDHQHKPAVPGLRSSFAKTNGRYGWSWSSGKPST